MHFFPVLSHSYPNVPEDPPKVGRIMDISPENHRKIGSPDLLHYNRQIQDNKKELTTETVNPFILYSIIIAITMICYKQQIISTPHIPIKGCEPP